MKNKGFTLVEVLAVIVILALLASLAVVAISRYRAKADETDRIELKSSIETSYNNYRSSFLDSRYDKDLTTDEIKNNNWSFFKDLSYNGKRIQSSDIESMIVSMKIKGDLLTNPEYIKEGNPADDGVCVIKSTFDEDGNLVNACVSPSSPSNEELLCVKVELEKGGVIIDDFNDEKSLCHYWSS